MTSDSTTGKDGEMLDPQRTFMLPLKQCDTHVQPYVPPHNTETSAGTCTNMDFDGFTVFWILLFVSEVMSRFNV